MTATGTDIPGGPGTAGRGLDPGTFFDGEAERYDRAHDDPGVQGESLRARLAMVARLVGVGPGDVLDVGMGPGRLLGELAARGWTPSGVDASPGMVGRARERLPEAARRLLVGRIEMLPSDSERFDAVVATGVLEYSTDLRVALAELHRVLRPGGRAVVSVPNPRAVYSLWYGRVVLRLGRLARRLRGVQRERPLGQGAVPRERFEHLLAEVGFGLEAVEYASFGVVPAPIDRLLPVVAARAARAVEGSVPTLGPRLGTQVVFAARKPSLARGDASA
jgi:ubiquinone/menaquinone biosynthesis C-methylase UbiE